MNISPFPHSLSMSSFSLHFLILSPFPLHFLILSPFSRSPAARLQQVVQPWNYLAISWGHIRDKLMADGDYCCYRKDTGATRGLNIPIKLFVMVWVETAECPLSLLLFVFFDKHLTEFGQRLFFSFWM